MTRNRKLRRIDRALYDTIWALYQIHGKNKTQQEYAEMIGAEVSCSSIGRVIRSGGIWAQFEKGRNEMRDAARRKKNNGLTPMELPPVPAEKKAVPENAAELLKKLKWCSGMLNAVVEKICCLADELTKEG